MNFDFLSRPVDFPTAYFIIFGSVALCAAIIVFLDQLAQRHDRRARRPQK